MRDIASGPRACCTCTRWSTKRQNAESRWSPPSSSWSVKESRLTPILNAITASRVLASLLPRQNFLKWDCSKVATESAHHASVICPASNWLQLRQLSQSSTGDDVQDIPSVLISDAGKSAGTQMSARRQSQGQHPWQAWNSATGSVPKRLVDAIFVGSNALCQQGESGGCKPSNSNRVPSHHDPHPNRV